MKIKTRWLLLLPLLTVPVAAEMLINQSGLPTPWPIALIGIFISLVSMFLFKSEKLSFSWFAKTSLIYNIIRSLITLVGSGISLAIYGFRGFHYPLLFLLNTLTLPFIMFSVKQGIEKLEVSLIAEEIVFRNRNDEERSPNSLVEQKHYQTLKRIYSLCWLCWGIVGISFILYALATVNTLTLSSRNWDAQFITSCVKEPNKTQSWPIVYCEKNDPTYRCLVEAGFGGWNLMVRLESLSVAFLAILSTALPTMFPNLYQRFTKLTKGFFIFFIYLLPWLIVALYVWVVASIQNRGFDDLKLKDLQKYDCTINTNFLSSKTGYLSEWVEQELTSFSATSIKLSRQLALL